MLSNVNMKEAELEKLREAHGLQHMSHAQVNKFMGKILLCAGMHFL